MVLLSQFNISVYKVMRYLGIEYIARKDGIYYMVNDSGEKISGEEFFHVMCRELFKDNDKDELYM